jgi:hypothetical protein
MLSLGHPALMQAILALGSLQIAKLKEVPPTTSLRHYHYALRRIARNIGKPEKRVQPSNLAATLLLSYYEVWNSDHEKWSKHLLGARWVLKDIPLSDMTRSAMIIKRGKRKSREMEKQRQQHCQAQSRSLDPFTEPPASMFDDLADQSEALRDDLGPLHEDWDMVDIPLLSMITGKDMTPEELGMSDNESEYFVRQARKFTDKDVEEYEHYCDLFWWYCKMDVYKSILGGTKLL